jgi:putative Mn2+ efflux pump MntP
MINHWLHWIAAFLIVILLLLIAAGIQNEVDRRKERRK